MNAVRDAEIVGDVAANDAVGVPANDAATRARPCALIVDDSPFLARQLARQLECLGFATHSTADIMEVQARAVEADLICVELQLFQLSGFEVTRMLAEACSCPLLLLSGTGRKTDRQWGLRAGASAVLTRPLCAQQLQATLARLGCTGARR